MQQQRPWTKLTALLLVLCTSGTGTLLAVAQISNAGTQPSADFVSDFANLTAIFGSAVATSLNTTVYNGCVL